MSPSHTEIVHKEIDRMPLTGIITPIESSSTSPVVIATKNTDTTVLCRLLEAELGDEYRSLAFA